MKETQATLTELRQNMADLINRAAYGGERVVLISHGEPKAVLVSLDDLRQLKQVSDEEARRARRARALEDARRLREEIRAWQEANNITPEDSVETLRRLREERDEEILGLR